MKYRVENCVSDSCIKDDRNEIVLIVNSRANALTICEILNLDENHENGILAPIVWESQKVKETAREVIKKFISQIEFHGIATMDGDLEYFKISGLGLREIAREQFGVEVEE